MPVKWLLPLQTDTVIRILKAQKLNLKSFQWNKQYNRPTVRCSVQTLYGFIATSMLYITIQPFLYFCLLLIRFWYNCILKRETAVGHRESDNVKTTRAAGDRSQQRQVLQALHPAGTRIAVNTRAGIQGFTNSQSMNSKCFQFEATFTCNLAASVPLLLSFQRQSALLLKKC